MNFTQLKIQRLKTEDLSKKGSIDHEIIDVVKFINQQDFFCTTSSCSGRIAVFSESTESSKKGCQWLYTSHQQAKFEDVKSSLSDTPICGTAVFKFEPFILHVQCRSLSDAKLMHQVAVESGFRNSGITIGKNGKIMMAVRSTHGLEVPLADNGTILVSFEYVSYLVGVANSKMDENSRRIERFFSNLKLAVGKPIPQKEHKAKQKQASQHAVKHKAMQQCNTVWTSCPHSSHQTYCLSCCTERCSGKVAKSQKCENGVWGRCDKQSGILEDSGGAKEDIVRSSTQMDVVDDLENGLQLFDIDS